MSSPTIISPKACYHSFLPGVSNTRHTIYFYRDDVTMFLVHISTYVLAYKLLPRDQRTQAASPPYASLRRKHMHVSPLDGAMHKIPEVKMGDLLDYLRDARKSDPGACQENTFSQVLNIWLRHVSKREETSDKAHQTVVGSKAYPLCKNGTTHLKFGVETIRGYFSSVRFGEGMAWVNVNVTHGAFFRDLPLKEWVRDAHLNDAELREALKGVRVQLTHRRANVNGSQKDIIKVISGLATPMDGHPEKGQPTPANPPKVPPTAPASAARCGQVSFYDKDGKKYVTVFSHFRKS
ncbi:hypothetical protein VTK73DRAFT_4185 [Phialemonium thermophilum]|uniref:Argonaute linker 1 domain-containing protein n=1 Tax=Phialemonium thermophilum TaxID=223376 RepID=A0ABR3WVH2_9PEZI